MNRLHISKLIVAIAIALISCPLTSDWATAEMRISELQNRPAEELAEMVRSLVDDESKVAAHKNTLVVNASPAELVGAARLVASYDRAQRMLRVTVAQEQALDDQSCGLSMSGRLQEGPVLVDLGRNQRDSSSLRLGSRRNQVNLQAHDSSRQQSRQISQFMTVIEGYPARISVGRSVPFTSQMFTCCRLHPAFVETITYQHVDTGFEVFQNFLTTWSSLRSDPSWFFRHAKASSDCLSGIDNTCAHSTGELVRIGCQSEFTGRPEQRNPWWRSSFFW